MVVPVVSVLLVAGCSATSNLVRDDGGASGDSTVGRDATTTPGVDGAIPGTDGKAGMVAVKLRDGQSLDPVKLAAHLYEALPSYAIPLFVRIVDELESTSTFKTRKVELRNEAYGETGTDPVFVLSGRATGYVPFYDGYAADVAAAKVPRG